MENPNKKSNHLFLEFVERIVYSVLRKNNILLGEWHLGKVKTVLSTKLLEVYVDGSDVAMKIPCNPDVTFAVGDEVFVQFINRDTKNKFIPYKRGV